MLAPVANAEKLPIKITPTQVITTSADEIEVGDWIKFKTVNDVFYKNKLLIKKIPLLLVLLTMFTKTA